MTIKELVSHIAKQEGKKHQASVGDVREIVSLISDMFYADLNEKEPRDCISTIAALYKNGKRRAKRKK